MSRSNRKRSRPTPPKSAASSVVLAPDSSASKSAPATLGEHPSACDPPAVPAQERSPDGTAEAISEPISEPISEAISEAISEPISEPIPAPPFQTAAQTLPAWVPSLESTSVEILESLHTLLQRFDHLDGRLDGWADLALASPTSPPPASETLAHSELADDLQHLQTTLDEAWRANEELRHQNETLAAQVAQSSVRHTVGAAQGGDESLSWEERKQLMMRQMEDDSFDADAFVNSLPTSAQSHVNASDDEAAFSPQEFVERLVEKLQRAEQTICHRDGEVSELRMLLENQSETRANGTAIGAAAIASMIDSDALVMEERERLQQLKNDWEDKFRKAEIEVSLERAKLSRERQGLAKRAQELEEKLDELQREKRDQLPNPKPARRWLAELGLGTDAS